MILTGNSHVNPGSQPPKSTVDPGRNMNKVAKTNGQSRPRSLRKRDASRPSARKRIFDTASELFYRRGIRAVGVETIAAEADTTKMSLYRNFPSKDELVAEWLREHDARFWEAWEAMASRYPDAPRRQMSAAFGLLAKHVVDPKARGCPMANAAIEITEKDHPARKVIEAHKAKLRNRLLQICIRIGVAEPRLLADQLFLLMEGAQVTTQTLGVHGPARNIVRSAKMLIDMHLRALG
jgi:AcrR family transcriptional regulator